MNSKMAYGHQKMVEKAIDALIDLEGTVYPNGLVFQVAGALTILREKATRLMAEGDRLKAEEDNRHMIASVVEGALAQEPKRMTSMIAEIHEFDEVIDK